MEEKKQKKLPESLNDLSRCLMAYEPSSESERSITFIAITKAFEVALEYGWKELKRIIEDRGLEAYSPKDVVREAANINLISDPKLWINCINARNLSVHDYFSLSESGIVELAKIFLDSAKNTFDKIS